MKYRAPDPIPSVLKVIYEQQGILRRAFPKPAPTRRGKRGKPKKEEGEEHGFALDGNLVGDIGEAIAERFFGLEKLPGNSQSHDFVRPEDGLQVQVKTTQKAAASKQVGLGLKKTPFKHLLVFELEKDGSFEVIFNGPGSVIDKKRENKESASLSRLQLRECQTRVGMEEQLKMRTDFNSGICRSWLLPLQLNAPMHRSFAH